LGTGRRDLDAGFHGGITTIAGVARAIVEVVVDDGADVDVDDRAAVGVGLDGGAVAPGPAAQAAANGNRTTSATVAGPLRSMLEA
jgi:hypothetical protein